MKLLFAAQSATGNRAGPNEDCIGWNDAANLWVLADGMGGHAAGEIASRLTVEHTLRWAVDSRLAFALLKAHEAVVAAAHADAALSGMGSTVVAWQLRERGCEIAWVGDSRCYLWRDGRLMQLTQDHSLARALGPLATGHVAHTLTQAIGMDNPQPEVISRRVRVGDIFLLATDGLTSEASDETISSVLQSTTGPEAGVAALLQAAIDHGGRDNISIILIQVTGRWFERPALLYPLLVIALLLLALIGWSQL
jgi:protein phosphatase